MNPSRLAEWDNFYVIVGSAAAGLTGVTFVVISLAAEAQRLIMVGLRTFVTPTIVHFGAVLALSAYLTVSHHSVLSLCIGLAVAGVAGLVYIGAVTVGMRAVTAHYVPVQEDRIWNPIVPAFASAGLAVTAGVCWHDLGRGLYGVARVCVLLLFTDIHNA